MKPNLLVVVSGYAGDGNQVSDFLPYYRHHGFPVLVLSPEDSPIVGLPEGLPWLSQRQVGLRGYTGPHTLERQRLSMGLLNSTSFTHFLWHDADSLCLSPRLPGYLFDGNVLWNNEVLDTNKAPSLLPKLALQPPYFFNRAVLAGLLDGAKHPATSYYLGADLSDADRIPVPTGCIDHWMLQVAHGGGVEHRNFPDGASFETRSQHGLDTMIHHVRDLRKRMVHSVKTKEAARILMALAK